MRAHIGKKESYETGSAWAYARMAIGGGLGATTGAVTDTSPLAGALLGAAGGAAAPRALQYGKQLHGRVAEHAAKKQQIKKWTELFNKTHGSKPATTPPPPTPQMTPVGQEDLSRLSPEMLEKARALGWL